MTEAAEIIEKLALSPHPEGGWYAETWRSDTVMGAGKADDARASATAIYFLLERNQRSAWHRVDATELWLWHAGDPLRLSMKDSLEANTHDSILGPDPCGEQYPQIRVPAHIWQAAEPWGKASAGWTLVSCIVSPGFEFSGFELAE